MLTREELGMLNVENLRKYASSIKVKKIRTYKKPELIEEVLRVQHEIEEEFGTEEELVALKTESEKESELDTIDKSNDEVEANVVVAEENTNTEDKHLSYIENAPVGTIVAFKVGSKVKSAKIVNRSSGRRKLKLETAYGKVFVVDYDDILWVRTSKRWPKGIYQLFGKNKAVNTNGEEG